jgi:glycosyltransferase involved in cell wall biosynthesis
MNKKILIFCLSKSWGGTEKNTVELAIGLLEKGYSVSLVHSSSAIHKKISSYNINEYYYIKRGGDFNPFFFYKLFKLIKSFSPDVCYMTLRKDYWIAGLLSYYLKVKKRILYIGGEKTYKKSYKNKYIFEKLPTDMIVNSKNIKNSLIERFKDLSGKIHIIYNGIQINQNNLEFKKIEPGNTLVIGSAGRITYLKGFDKFVTIVETIHKKNPNIKFHIAGEGDMLNDVRKELEKRGLDHVVLFLGFCENMDNFYKEIDLFILFSRLEGMPTVINEAMSYGVNVVTTMVSGVEELLLNGKLGEIVYEDDGESFGNRVVNVLQNNNLRNPSELREHIEKNYSIKKMIDETEDVFFNK